MELKRHREEEGRAGDGRLPSKRGRLLSTLLKGESSSLELIIREWVHEEVKHSINLFLRSSDSQIEGSRSRSPYFKFLTNLACTVFTGNRLVSEDTSPIKFALFDPTSGKTITSGPYSSMKAEVLVLEGDFLPDCQENWSKKDFDSKVVVNRPGKRPLVTGESIVPLQDGVGCIGDISFTDNSSWTRSGKFRLGVKVHSGFDGTSIRGGVSNAFRVKDHRGESYQKHHPPSPADEIWRLENIAKDGAFHKRLKDNGIVHVRDFLRSYATDQISLRAVLGNVSNKQWDAIVRHATTCVLDCEKHVCGTSEQGSGPFLDTTTMNTVEELKRCAYGNSITWEDSEANLHVKQGQLEMQTSTDHHNSFEVGESSQVQGINLTFINSFPRSDSPGRFYIGEQTWASGDNHLLGPQLSHQEFKLDENFVVESSASLQNLFSIMESV